MARRTVFRIKPFTPEWEKEANALARSSIRIRPCGLCGHPAIDGYICPTCGGDDSAADEGEDETEAQS